MVGRWGYIGVVCVYGGGTIKGGNHWDAGGRRGSGGRWHDIGRRHDFKQQYGDSYFNSVVGLAGRRGWGGFYARR